VEQRAGVKLTKNPDGRATMGLSSSGAAAFTMAWFHPELYRRVLAYSPTMVNQNGHGTRRCAAARGNITAPGRGRPDPTSTSRPAT
jgi:S-formylglutathione hydrolase FrmB